MKINCNLFKSLLLAACHKKSQVDLGLRFINMSNNHTSKKGLVAVCQITSKNNVSDNFEVCRTLVELASARKAQVVFLPEACDYVGENISETLSLAHNFAPLKAKYQDLAKQNNIWISLGGVHEKISDHKVGNAHLLITNEGETIAMYRKTHLFNVNLPEKGIRLTESDYVQAGQEVIDPVKTPVGKIGLSVCYDVRFPELSLTLRNRGADILTFPSAFTFATGSSHWETLLKCRAIENQCYVVAAAQTGAHNKKRTSYGHAMVIDPWGSVVAQCSEGTGLAMAEIDLDYLLRVRNEMPVMSHRRPDLYPSFVDLSALPADDDVFQFGQVKIQGNTVFYKTPLTIAFTNKKCVLPGHVLVAPIREAKRLSDLSPQEVSDLFLVVQKVQRVMETIHQVNSSTVVVQDGPDAGQTIRQVHVHILPRKKGDFYDNDEIYNKLQKHDKPEDTQPWRTEEEMQVEAIMIRGYFH